MYILAIDQGTTSSRAIIYDDRGRVVQAAQREFNQIFPQSGWVEHDPQEIWRSVKRVMEEVLEGASIEATDLAAIGITNQRETTVLWDKKLDEPVHNAIVWQCRRSSDICQALKDEGLEATFTEKTGLVLDPYFSGTKIKWIFHRHPQLRKRAEKGELLFGTIDSWLIWRLTGGEVHVTDYTNASRTLIYNIHRLEWDDELLSILDIPGSILPEVLPSSHIYGYTAPQLLNGARIPVAGIAGDQQAATFAQGCFEKGMAKITFGTGSFMLMNTADVAVKSRHGLLTTIAWGLEEGITYALEGSIFVAGAAFQWLRDGLRILHDAADSQYFARKLEDNGGVYLVPALTGLGAPYWEPRARGMMVGLSRGTTREHLIRATLESIVYQSQDLLSSMVADSGITLKELRVDGGAAANNLLLQFLADITHVQVERPVNTETTAAGAAFLAGLAVGFWQSQEEILEKRITDEIFLPQRSPEEGRLLYEGWQRAVKALLFWSQG